MPNKKRYRRIMMPPQMEGFKPFGVSKPELESVNLLYEEFEAIRLCDYEELTQDEAANRMQISRPTFNRIYNQARKIIAKAFVENKVITIKGGAFISEDYWFKCYNCNEIMITLKPIIHCRSCNSDNINWLNMKPEKEKQL